MLRRLLPTILPLGVGLLLMGWGLVALHGIFADERRDALVALTARRAALAQYGARALEQSLERRVQGSVDAMEAALRDPLVPDGDLLLVLDGRTVLPLRAGAGPGQGTPGRDLADALVASPTQPPQPGGPGGPWTERLALFAVFARALDARDVPAQERAFREILAHRQRYEVPAADELGFDVALLEVFLAGGQPDPALLRMVLRDGVRDGRGAVLVGLQQLLLRSVDRLTAPDAQALAARLAALCRRAQVRFDDFERRMTEVRSEPVAVPGDLAAPALVAGGRFFAAPAPGGVIRGVAVDLGEAVDAVGAAMQARGLLAEGERLTMQLPPRDSAAVIAVGDARFDVDSPRWEAGGAEIDRRYALKSWLLLACALLGVAIVGLALLAQVRKHHFLQMKADFVATVSHELRTPLASVRLLAETLERRLAGTGAARDYPSRIVRDVDGLAFLVENILSFDRLERGRIVPRLADVPLEEVVEAVREDARYYTTVPVRLRTAGVEGTRVAADPELLRVLLANLARNSCRYNDNEAVEILVAAENGNGTVLRFQDNGVGIDKAEWRRVFDDFYRPPGTEERARRSRGTGLGLAICRRIMRAHRGHIRIASSGSGGTTFELRFPHK